MSYDILRQLGLDHLDTRSPDFLAALERLQRDAWLRLQAEAVDAPAPLGGSTAAD